MPHYMNILRRRTGTKHPFGGDFVVRVPAIKAFLIAEKMQASNPGFEYWAE